MSLISFIPLFLIYIFGLVNIVGIRSDLATTSILHFSMGLILFFVIRYLQMHVHFFRNNSFFFYIFFIVLLILTSLFGMEVNGSRRWIDLGVFPLQTSEIFKVFFIVFLAHMFSRVRSSIEWHQIFVKGLAVTALPFILILRQPDLGSSIILGAIFIILAVHSHIPKKQIATFFLIIILLLPLTWFGMHDYQQARIKNFINPGHDASGTSYNMTQANISVGSGQLFGKGLGMGKQSQLSFLPEYHTDFAFSSLVEQFGFLGGFILIILYLWFFANLFIEMFHHVGKKDQDEQYAFYYLLGFSVIFISQAAINIGMNVGLLPVAGITLPFISYGGSSLITFLVAMALIPRVR